MRDGHVTITPLPKFQLFLTFLIQAAEPVTATVIYPFITKFVRSTGITDGDETRTGYYAGIIESIFFLSESALVYQWGRASDVYGRRPILLLGPLGLAFAMFGFGLSKTFWSMVLFRCAQGIFNGNIGVAKTVIAEFTDETNMAEAFTYIPIMWSFGAIVGPSVGGVLADPALRWPNVFGRLAFFREHPYFLPCAVAGLLSFFAFAFAYVGLKETLKPSVGKKIDIEHAEIVTPLLSGADDVLYGSTEPTTSPSSASSSSLAPPPGTTKLMTPGLKITLINYGFLAFTDMGYEVLIPLIYSTSIPVGGLGLTPYQIGVILGSYGFLSGVWNVFVWKQILMKIGPRKMYIVGYASLLAEFGSLWLLRAYTAKAGEVTLVVWALLFIQLFIATIINVTFSAMSLLVVAAAPPGRLGAVNGVAQMVSSGTRGLAPMFASSLFSLSLKSGVAGGHLVDIILMSITVLGILCSLKLPK